MAIRPIDLRKMPLSRDRKDALITGHSASSPNRMFKTAFYRPVWLPAAIATALLLVALVLLVGAAWRSAERLQPVHSHLTLLSHLQDKRLLVEQLLVEHLGLETTVDPRDLAAIRYQVQRLAARQDYLHADTPGALRHADQALGTFASQPRTAVVTALAELRRALALETQAHNTLLSEVSKAAQFELHLATAMLVALPLLAGLLLFLVRKRVLRPLHNLSQLMTLLGRQDYATIPTDDADPMLQPLFENYNHMVTQLATLEQERQARQESLEAQVRHASGALLEQQRKLADAERLAAVGELAAGIAHDLRNPLAGIQMALTNLRRETTDPDHAQRLDLITQELSRTTILLNNLLDQARHEPEPASRIAVAQTVKDLLALARYQIPPRVRIEQQVPADLICHLPKDGLHQAILNLVLNAYDALGAQAGTIVIEAHSDNANLVLEVRDDGPGFPEHLLNSGIRPFSTARQGGTGLGLAIVRRFVNDLGGEISLRNREPSGASVTLRLPCLENEHG